MCLLVNFGTLLLIKHVLALTYYCEFGFCEADQYCCGDNKCCDKLLDLWYFCYRLGVVIVIVVVATVVFLKYYCYYKKRRKSYFLLNLSEPDVEEDRVQK